MALKFLGLSRAVHIIAELYLVSLFFGKFLTSVDTMKTVSRLLKLNIIEDKNLLFFFFYKKSLLFSGEALIDLTCVDMVGNKERYKLVYNIVSYYYNRRTLIVYSLSMSFKNFFVKTNSVSSLFQSALWLEREVWDLFGIFFLGHIDLRRILTDYGFRGFPLRKEYPLSGFLEVRYDFTIKSIVMDDIFFLQEFRNFSFLSSWDRI